MSETNVQLEVLPSSLVERMITKILKDRQLANLAQQATNVQLPTEHYVDQTQQTLTLQTPTSIALEVKELELTALLELSLRSLELI